MANTFLDSSLHPQDDVDLTDNQIQQLLLEAECRLRGPLVPTEGSDDVRIPKLSSGNTLAPYVRQNDELATFNSAQVIDPKQRELSNTLHPRPENKTVKVSFNPGCLLQIAMRKIFPTHERLMWRNQSVLGCAALVRAFIFHSYSEHLIPFPIYTAIMIPVSVG